MNCYKCSRDGKNKTDNKYFCDKCFLEIIEKRIRKEIRTNSLIEKNDKILILNDSSQSSILNQYFLKKIIYKPNIKIKKIKRYEQNFNYDKKNEYTKIIIPHLLDNEIEMLLESFFEDKKEFLNNNKNIKLLISITKDEANAVMSILKINTKNTLKNNETDISKMIENLEKRYSGTKFSLLKSIKNLKQKT